ncbi:MAG TPA: hypothetical protein VH305_04195 [Gaiella sp.]
MRAVRRIVLGLVGVLAVLGYVWVAAVRAVPGIRRRKAGARAHRAAR